MQMRRLLAILVLCLTLVGQLQAAECPMGGRPAEETAGSHHRHDAPPVPDPPPSAPDHGCGQLMACGIVCVSAQLAVGPISHDHAVAQEVSFRDASPAPFLTFDPPPPRATS